MRWKKYITADQAALLAVGLSEFKTISNASAHLLGGPEPRFTLDDDDNGVIANHNEQSIKNHDLIGEANAIKEALIDELWLVDPLLDDSFIGNVDNTHLELAHRAQASEFEDYFVPEKSTITRNSLAIWFYHMGDTTKAKVFNQSVELLIEEQDKQVQKPKVKAEISSKPRTPEISLMKSIGLMSLLLSKEQANYKNGTKPNFSNISTHIEQKAAELSIELEQISNLKKDLSTAYKLLGLS